jgi:hypothetical protein
MYIYRVPKEFADPPLGLAFWHAQLLRFMFGRPTADTLARIHEAKRGMGWTPGMRVAAVHYRANDKVSEAPPHDLQEYIEAALG